MKKILMVVGLALFALAPAQAEKKPPKHCDKKNERFANPYGSVLVVRNEMQPVSMKEGVPGEPGLDNKIFGSVEPARVGKRKIAVAPQYPNCSEG